MKKIYLLQITTGLVIVFLFVSLFVSGINGFEKINDGVLSEPVLLQGSGTLDDPIMIYDVYDLQDMNNDLTAHYALANNINASETIEWNGGAGFEPVGYDFFGGAQFSGSFYGNNYTITGLYINRPDTNWVGLFGYVFYGEVSNVGVVDADLTGKDRVGGLVGENAGGIVSASYTTGEVNGVECVGGLVGWNRYGTVSNSYATIAVSGDFYVGGLVGLSSGTVSKTYATGDVSGDWYVGGLVGSSSGTVSNSFWDIETSGQGSSDGGTGKTTQEMQSIQTYTDISTVGLDDAWDMIIIEEYEDEIWYIDDGIDYPGLGWSLFDGAINNPPVFGMPIPENNSIGNSLSFVWSIPINDLEGDRFSWSIECSNGQSSSGTLELNGTKKLHLVYLKPSSTYMVWVNATDPTGSGQYTRAWYIFSTQTSGIDIINITGGFGIEAVVINTGDILIEGIQWSIQLDDGFIFTARNITGTLLALDVNAQRRINSKPILGFGRTEIRITAKSDTQVEVNKTVQAFIFFIFVLLN